MMTGAIGDTQFVQAQFELQQVAPVLGIRAGNHHPDSQPVLKLVFVHHRQH